nr:VP5 [Jeddah tick coltivirus]
MSSTQAVIYMYSVPTDCSIEVVVRDTFGNVLPDVSVKGYCSRGNVIVNGMKATHACDLTDGVSVMRSGILNVVERVTKRLCEEGDTEALSNVLSLLNQQWPSQKDQDFKRVWNEILAHEAGTFNRLTMIEHKTDWVATTTAATWRMVHGLWNAFASNGLIGPVKREDGSLLGPDALRALGGGLLYDNNDDVSTLVYGPLKTKVLRYEGGATIVSDEPKVISGIAPAGAVPFVVSSPLVAYQQEVLPSSTGHDADSSAASSSG